MKKLKLSKETLIALQDRQMKAAHGGEEGISMTNCGYTAQYECTPTPVPTESLEPAPEGEAATCCRKSCRR